MFVYFNSLSRWLHLYGVQTESERKMRKQQKLIIGDNIHAEYLPMKCADEVNGGTRTKNVPCVEVKSLTMKVHQQLDDYDK